MPSREKAKLIIAEIVQQAGGEFYGKTRLYKAFYIAHLEHYREHSGVLSDHPVVRMPRGPAIDAGDKLLRELRDQGVLTFGKRPNGPFQEEVFTLRNQVDGLSPDEVDSIRRAVDLVRDKSATQLSDWTHLYSNTWDETPNGHQMNIYADLLTESEYEEMRDEHRKAKELVDAVFT